MPDVDLSVRFLTKACTSDYNDSPFNEKMHLIDEFIKLPQSNIPSEMRGKNRKQITDYILNLFSNVKNAIEETFECDVVSLYEDSKDNKVGSDLIAKIRYDSKITNEKIELKFGKETLRAIGIATFNKIFIVDYESGYFVEKFADCKDNQRKFADEHPGDVENLIKNLSYQLAPIIDDTNNKKNNGVLHIDSNEMISQLSGTGSINSNEIVVAPTKLYLTWSGINVSEQLDLSGKWSINEISPSTEKGARINFLVSNGKTEAKFLLHWKNDMVYNGYKYPAKTGINSYCFNVWAWRIK